jgi:hypothetical protein
MPFGVVFTTLVLSVMSAWVVRAQICMRMGSDDVCQLILGALSLILCSSLAEYTIVFRGNTNMIAVLV